MVTTNRYRSDHAAVLAGPDWLRCEELIRQFEDAWARKQAPAIEEFVSTGPAEQGMLLLELIHIDMEFRLKAGEPVRVESYLQRFPQVMADEKTMLDLLSEEFRLRQAAGQTVHVAEYELRFPHYASTITGRLAADADTSTGDRRVKGIVAFPSIPGYDILHEIGRGGMGIIYQARDPALDRHVALKFLPEEYLRDADHLQRFLHEARTASALNHPNICTVHALGKHEGRPYIVLEYIEGTTLRAWAQQRPELRDVLTVIRQSAGALTAAHAAGVVHRDLKPDNIMLRPDGITKVVDFGLARRVPLVEQPGPDTDPGAVFGTAAYMSPEQTRGEPLDSASDIFSLGIVLYQLAAGRHPFDALSAAGIMHAIATEQPIAPSAINPAMPRRLDDLVAAMLHKDPLLRPTAAEVLDTLTHLLDTEPAPTPAIKSDRPVVHREAELAVLRSALARADAGQGSVVCVSGEPGIGKTTLVEDFLEGVATEWPFCAMLRGHCSERLAGMEAYSPILDALGHLCRTDTAGTAGRHVKVLAPSWHAQLGTPGMHMDTITPPKAMSQNAMLREFWNLLQELTRRGPAVVFIDDVHWADVSTVDLLAHLGAQCRSARLLVVVTYRPTEMLIGPHPFHGVRLELQTKGWCQELPLGFLDREQVGRYVSLAFPNHDLSTEFLNFLVARTEGSPLFIADLLCDLRERGVLVESAGRWSLTGTVPDLRRELPSSVRGMIERKLERLEEAEHRLLAAAAVQGHEFDSVVVAGAAGLDPATAEEHLRSLERVHGLVRQVREHEMPDHSLTTRYAFVHALYQQALYTELSPSRRASLANALAAALQRHHEQDCPAVANELAHLFEVGRDFRNAAQQFWFAARHAARLFAHREAVALARRGVGLLKNLAASAERDALELSLQTILGLQLQVTHGFAAPAAREAYSRARQLCPSPHTIQSFPVLWGLWLDAKVRSELDLAMDLARELEDLALRAEDRDCLLQSQQALAVTTLCRGDLAATVRHMEKANELYDIERHRSHSFQFGQDPAVACLAFGAVALQLLGETEHAKKRSRQALELSYRLMQPSSQVLALHFAAMLYQLCGERDQTRIFAEMCAAIATEHSFAFWQAGSLILRGWTAADPATGSAMIRQGLIDWEATGSLTYKTYYLGLLAEVLRKQGQHDEAAGLVEEALALADATREHLYVPELRRLQSLCDRR
jgi:predicted ATPase